VFYHPHPIQACPNRAGRFKHRSVESGKPGWQSTGGIAETFLFYLVNVLFILLATLLDFLASERTQLKSWSPLTGQKVDEIFTSERGTEGKLWSMPPRGFVRSKKRNHSGAIELVSHQRFHDSVRHSQVVQTNPQVLNSSDWDFIHIDEPCP